MRLSSRSIRQFRKKIYDYYDLHGRDLPWRKRPTPYKVLISEIMLQQTQVERVLPKYSAFIARFPDFQALARAPLPRLLKIWCGLGYNRRALALRSLAKAVIQNHRGRLPSDPVHLLALPGIGKYTAGAILAFAFNRPAVFVDTNIRRVYIHEFFADRHGVHDDELRPLVDQTSDDASPRKWFNALMDYGAMLKQRERNNPNRRSAHYIRQSPFKNSNRQVRGKIVSLLVKKSCLTEVQIAGETGVDLECVRENLGQLEREGFIKKKKRRFAILTD